MRSADAFDPIVYGAADENLSSFLGESGSTSSRGSDSFFLTEGKSEQNEEFSASFSSIFRN